MKPSASTLPSSSLLVATVVPCETAADVVAARAHEVEHLADAGEEAVGGVARRRGGLRRDELARLLVERDDVGERAARVDADADPARGEVPAVMVRIQPARAVRGRWHMRAKTCPVLGQSSPDLPDVPRRRRGRVIGSVPRVSVPRWHDVTKESDMAQYLIGVDFQAGDDPAPMSDWTPEEVQAHLDYYGVLIGELEANGELVSSTILTGPDLARSSGPTGRRRSSPTARSRSSRSGWPASRSSRSTPRSAPSRSRRGCRPSRAAVASRRRQPIHVRQVMEQAPSDTDEMDAFLRTAAGLPAEPRAPRRRPAAHARAAGRRHRQPPLR